MRAVLVTPRFDVLLCRFEFPSATVWALPGGGLDPGEDHATAFGREMAEELGLRDIEFGTHIWTREQLVPFIDGAWDGQRDHYHLVAVAARFDPIPDLTWEQLRAERVHELRWWTIEEVDAATAGGTRFAPGRLGELLRSLRDDGVPGSPLDTGV